MGAPEGSAISRPMSTDMDATLDLIALCAVPDVGPATARRLVSAFGSPGAVFDAPPGALAAVDRVSRKQALSIKSFTGRDEVKKRARRLMDEGVRVETPESAGYPEPLNELGNDAPLVLYMKGDYMKEDRYAVSIVGSRRPTSYGKMVAEKLSSELSSMGFTVVSGLARGVDTAAHKGALAGGGRTVGVMGSGIDVPYPPENKALMERAGRSGCVLSEFPPGMPPNRENFPRRNRLISGLSMGVLVVEAGGGSGALITARYALEQGKEVFAVPGNINSPASRGANDLIKEGARAVTRAEDIVQELAPLLRGFIKKQKKQAPSDMGGDEKTLCDIMSEEPRHIDALSRQAGMPAAKALSVLLGLELRGIVKQTEGKRFYLA